MKNYNIHINTHHRLPAQNPPSSPSSAPTSRNIPSSPTSSTATLAHEEILPSSLTSFLPSDHEIFHESARILEEHAATLKARVDREDRMMKEDLRAGIELAKKMYR